MMRARSVRRIGWGVAGVSCLAAAAIAVAPPTAHAPPLPPPATTWLTLPSLALDTMTAEEIVMANVFAASRTAPSARYAPGEASGDVDPVAFVDDAATSTTMDHPQLLGTVVAAGTPRALLQLHPASGARLYAEGEEDAGYRIVSIAPRVVVLRAAGGGRITLRLDPEEDRP